MGWRCIAVITFVTLWTTCVSAAERVETITTRSGITQKLYVVEPDTAPWAVAMLYVGGDGELSLDKKMPSGSTGNFVVRIRDQLLASGIMLVYPDVPSDHGGGYGNFRNDARHVADAEAIVAWIRSHEATPLFVIGTSRGTISASTLGAHLAPDTFAGIALTSSVTRRGGKGQEAIESDALANIHVPVLVMRHRDDACSVSPPGDAPHIIESLKVASRKDSVLIEGGSPPKSGPCDALSGHGYFGVEDKAASAIIDWMKSVVSAP